MASVSGMDSCGVRMVDPERVAVVRAALPVAAQVDGLAEVFGLLSDPGRLRLLTSLLEGGELCVCDLAAACGLSESAVSHALRLLRASRVVSVSRRGRMAYYRLDDSHVRMLLDLGLTHIAHTDRPAHPDPTRREPGCVLMTPGHGHTDAHTDDAQADGHTGHSHGVSADADRRLLLIALLLLGGFMVAEVIVAVFSGSLALLSDAGHMLSDVGAIAGSLWAIRLAARPAHGVWTFGWKRAEILSAAANGITLLVVSGIVAFEAIRRLVNPPEVEGGPVLVVALAGVAVNIAAAWVLAKANRSSLNVEGAYQHIVTDLYAFIGTLIAAVVIITTGYTRADPIASLVVVGLMLRSAWGLLRDSGRVLLEAAPEGIDLNQVRAHLLEPEHVHDVHDLHVWTVTSNLPTVSAHVVIDDSCFLDGHAPQVLDELQKCLGGHFDVEHSTFQLEPVGHAAHESGTH